jgi:16S rRNA G966 N2-methylase RsmD
MIQIETLFAGLGKKILESESPLDKIAGLHKYWARKPWRVLDYFIQTHSAPGETVLDVFMGSGSAGLQAILNARNFVGVDLNPFACFLTEITLDTKSRTSSLESTFKEIEELVKAQIMNSYLADSGQYALWSKATLDDGVRQGQVANYDFENKTHGNLVFRNNPNRSDIELVFPDKLFPEKFYKDRFSYKGIKSVSDMFSDRNLNALVTLWSAINSLGEDRRKPFLLVFSNTLLHVSKLKSQQVRPLSVNNYWLPEDRIEENVWWRFCERFARFLNAKESIERELSRRLPAQCNFEILNQSCFELAQIESNSIDYVLTDPPYGEAIQYSELSYIWNTWLGFHYEIDEEVIVNPAQNKGNAEYLALLEKSLTEAFRVLKPGRNMTVAFHTRDLGLWMGLGHILGILNMRLISVNSFPPKGNPFTRNWAKFSPKTDIYLTLEKSSSDAKKESQSPINFNKVIEEVVEYAAHKHINSNELYDLFVSRLISYVISGHEITGLPKGKGLAAIVRELETAQGRLLVVE